DENAVADTEPPRPIFLEGVDILRLREDWIVLTEQIANRVEILARDIVFHQRPIEAGRTRYGGCHQNGPLNSMLRRSARSSGSQPHFRSSTMSRAAAAMVRAFG